MTSPRARLIVNPSSGRERGVEQAATIAAGLRRKYAGVEVFFTQGDGDAEAAAQQALHDGCSAIFVAGGDGTLNEVVNGVAAAHALDAVHFGIVPLGTGNDFASALGIPHDADQALEVLLRGTLLEVDLGRVNGRIFLNTSGGGYVAEVSIAVTPQLKTIAGRLAYLIGGAQALFEYEPVRATVKVDPGDVTFEHRLYAYAVCNSRLIGGGRLIAPDAIIDDGLLDVCLIEEMSAVEFVALGRKVADGGHVDDPRVHYLQGASVTITFERDTNINTDGEVLSATRAEYTVLPRAARFLTGDAPFSAAAQPAVDA